MDSDDLVAFDFLVGAIVVNVLVGGIFREARYLRG